MASGHVNRAEQAEHMAALTNAAEREESPCQLGAVHTWPNGEVFLRDVKVRFRGVERTRFAQSELFEF